MNLLEQIPILTEEDFEEREPQIELEDIALIHPSFTQDNPLTYFVFVSKRPDLSEEEKEYYLAVAQRLLHNENVKFKHAIKKMNDIHPALLEQQKQTEEREAEQTEQTEQIENK